MKNAIKCCLGVILGITTSVSAQERTEIQQRNFTTQKINGQAPSIDGRVDDPAWQMVEWSGDFTQIEPDHGAAPSEPTAIKILYDNDYLYVAVRAYDSNPSQIVKRLSRRDGFEGDWVEINIDSYNDKRTAFSFSASVSGVKGDEAVSDNGNNWDASWDPLWDFKTSIDNEGWIAEMKIPFTQLRFDANEVQT
ncbi:MAG: carbohydrate binding family 9 domain-containing protein [Balneolaceae bacterium]|nr:carbohydrate binding family 9 domain-containing protein [Balneolaceae bacterium]